MTLKILKKRLTRNERLRHVITLTQGNRYLLEKKKAYIDPIRGSVWLSSFKQLNGVDSEDFRITEFNVLFKNEPGIDEGGVVRNWASEIF